MAGLWTRGNLLIWPGLGVGTEKATNRLLVARVQSAAVASPSLPGVVSPQPARLPPALP